MPSRRVWRKLEPYQQSAVEFALKRRNVGLFFEQGTGKTWIAGGIIECLISTDFVGVVVGVLNNLETTWLEFLTTYLDVPVYRDWSKFRSAPTPKLFLIHYEGLRPIIKKMKAMRWSIVVADESHRLNNRGSQQSRNLARLGRVADRRVALSGTPIEQQPQDVWAQFRFIRPALLGTRWADFEDAYLEPLEIDLSKYRKGSIRWQHMRRIALIRAGKRKFDMRKLPQFLDVLAPYMRRVTKGVLNLPPLSIRDHRVSLRGAQRRLYDAIERDFVTRLPDDQRVTAPLRVVQIVKMHQICGGYVIGDDGVAVEVGRAKMRAMHKLLNGRLPVVVFCRYIEEVHAIHDEFVDEFDRIEVLTGKTRKNKRPQIVRDFQAGLIDVLICQQKTGGVGSDYYRSSKAIFYSHTYSSIDFDQAVSRLHRRGQKRPVTIFLLYAERTVDEAIAGAIRSKRDLTTAVWEHLKQRKRHHGTAEE